MKGVDKNKGVKKHLKVILLGDSGVGKTNIILRYIKDQFRAKPSESAALRTLSATMAARSSPSRIMGQRIPRDTVPTQRILSDIYVSMPFRPVSRQNLRFSGSVDEFHGRAVRDDLRRALHDGR